MKNLTGRIWGVEDFGEMLDYIEELEAEVESWKNSYERAVEEGAEDYERQDTTAISG